MIDNLLFVGYLLTCLWGFRFAAGAYISDMTYNGKVDGDDLFLGMLIGVMGAMLAPALLPGRMVYVLWRKHFADNPKTKSVIPILFPAPKEIESKKEKQERLERERRYEIGVQRSEINRREKELGLELTKW